MKWKKVDGLPYGIKVKVDMSPLEKFNGLCNLHLILTNNEAIFNRMDIEFDPYYGRYYEPEPQEPSEGTYP